jgi:putative Mg2+ transporter-C (MgtC) family protein
MSVQTLSSSNIEGWAQLGELGLAFALSSLIGIEREVRQKSAGLSTYTLVGVGAALFMLVSKYGFSDVLQAGRVVLDPSRVAAQIVTGIGFLGAGLIFVRRGSVYGLTTAAGIWLTAAVGSAAGAGLPVLAVASTAIYFVVVTIFKLLARRLPASSPGTATIRARYSDGRGILRKVLHTATTSGFTIDQLSAEPASRPSHGEDGPVEDGPVAARPALVELTMHVRGKPAVNELAAALSEIDGVEVVLAQKAKTQDNGTQDNGTQDNGTQEIGA